MVLQINWTDEELYSQITQVLSNITGLDPNRGEIRLAYSQQGQPSWRHTDTVIAYYFTPARDSYSEDITDLLKYDENNNLIDKEELFTQVLECRISCYGPNCHNLATLIKVGIQSDENRLNLSKVGIYPVSKIPQPLFLPYEYNKQWWLRSDLTINLNIFTKITSSINTIEEAIITTSTKDLSITNNINQNRRINNDNITS